MSFDFEKGEVLLIDKPLDWTSFDVVKKVRGAIKLKKIGHAGTLDPLASGLLILCTGKMTKQIDSYQAQQKEYTGTFVIGQTTPSYDLETEASFSGDIAHITKEDLTDAALKLTGKIMQVPPLFSAVKIEGKRAYLHARKGDDVKLEARSIEINSFEITDFRNSEVDFRIVCSKGTYIRSIARDFGDILGCGAYLSALRRTKIGDFDVANAWQLEALIGEIKQHHARLQGS